MIFLVLLLLIGSFALQDSAARARQTRKPYPTIEMRGRKFEKQELIPKIAPASSFKRFLD